MGYPKIFFLGGSKKIRNQVERKKNLIFLQKSCFHIRKILYPGYTTLVNGGAIICNIEILLNLSKSKNQCVLTGSIAKPNASLNILCVFTCLSEIQCIIKISMGFVIEVYKRIGFYDGRRSRRRGGRRGSELKL